MFDSANELNEQMKQVIALLVTAAKVMAGKDGDEFRAANAQMAMKQYTAFREAGFKANEAVELTCATLKGGVGAK